MIKVSVIGATGYAGAELLRLLRQHKNVEIAYITSESQTGSNIENIYPHLAKFYKMELTGLSEIETICANSDILFVALPHGHAMKICQVAAKHPVRVVDLGADYRFEDTSIYEQWYKVEHTDKQAKAVYAISELDRAAVKTAKIVANAGCYPTSATLALYPLVKNKLIDLKSIIVDAKSGTSGAGRTLKLGSHFCEVDENFNAYGVATHRHTPEIEQNLSKFADEPIVLSFTPHLLPVSRGILATCYATLKDGVTAADIQKAYQEAYENEYFIRLLGQGGCPAIKCVQASNFVDIGWQIDKRTNRIIAMSAIDNLVKGAAGQAIQNMNIMFNLPEHEGLEALPVYP